MCGIAGIIKYNINSIVSESDVRLMMKKIKHRGPDDEGVFLEHNIGLGFVRLSIIDLSKAGHQPMISSDQRYVIIFNGEVYNYIELKESLSSKYQFRSNTDTEVVLAAYQEWGQLCLNKFNGMFSFVVYDRVKKEVFGARDRFGIKPFYYHNDNDSFVFSSEIKAILPLVKKEPNDEIIFDYLLFNRTDHTENTFFKGIKKIQHGTYFIIRKNKFIQKKWYSLNENILANKSLDPRSFRFLFKDAIKLRLRSDVPIGVTLSGGIDSSSITSVLIKDFKLNNLNTFSTVYGVSEPTDESNFINEFRDIVRNMHFTFPDADTFFLDFETFIEAHNEPVPDIGPYAQFKVMELASEFVKVTLDGQGADEQLAGYHYFFGSYYLELLKELKFLKLTDEIIQYFKKHKNFISLKFLLYYLLPEELQKTVNNTSFKSINTSFIKRFNHRNELNKMLYKPKNLDDSLLQHFEYKLEHLLKWEDLNSMHFSIESRVPFLDHRLVEATLSTSSDMKIYKGETKHLLREALKDILPSKIVMRKDKKGFSSPREKWFRNEKIKNYIFELINSNKFKERGYFDSKVANKQFLLHLNNKEDHSKEIWKWINLELWFRKFMD